MSILRRLILNKDNDMKKLIEFPNHSNLSSYATYTTIKNYWNTVFEAFGMTKLQFYKFFINFVADSGGTAGYTHRNNTYFYDEFFGKYDVYEVDSLDRNYYIHDFVKLVSIQVTPMYRSYWDNNDVKYRDVYMRFRFAKDTNISTAELHFAIKLTNQNNTDQTRYEDMLEVLNPLDSNIGIWDDDNGVWRSW